jgi:hypothetical protein
LRATGTDAPLLACWHGDSEIEGIAIYNRDSSGDRDAALQGQFDRFRESLLRQNR